jgi:hypothetical protein
MKYVRLAMLALLTVSLAAAGTLGSEKDRRDETAVSPKLDWGKIEQQYVHALHDKNAGVVESAASFIRKYKLYGAADDLKKVFCQGCPENVRMSVAYALVTIGGDEGRTLVENALALEENDVMTLFYRTILNSAEISQN